MGIDVIPVPKKMPVIGDLVELTITERRLSKREAEILRSCLGRGGRLKSIKPNDPYAAFVWRMIAFHISTKAHHHCVPVSADKSLPSKDRDEWVKNVAIPMVESVVNMVPKDHRVAVKRWANSMGYGV